MAHHLNRCCCTERKGKIILQLRQALSDRAWAELAKAVASAEDAGIASAEVSTVCSCRGMATERLWHA